MPTPRVAIVKVRLTPDPPTTLRSQRRVEGSLRLDEVPFGSSVSDMEVEKEGMF